MKPCTLHSAAPVISVIIPVYNTESFIGACLDSICTQSLQDIEVICIDDGSSDHSGKILDMYSQQDDRVHVIHQANAGVSCARNTGIQSAHGEYILFADSDDSFKPGAFEALYAKAKAKELDILYFDADTTYASETLRKEYASYQNYYHRNLTIEGACSGEQMFVLMQQARAYRAHCCLQMIRREYLEVSGVRFAEDTRVHEDDLFSLQLLLLAQQTDYLPAQLYVRHIRSDSAITSAVSKGYEHFDGYFKLYIRMYKHMQNHPLHSSNAQQILKDYLRRILRTCMSIYQGLPVQEQNRIKHAAPEIRLYFEAFFIEWMHDHEQARQRELSLQRPGCCLKNLIKSVFRFKNEKHAKFPL